jgi:hypothetical protein
VTAQEESKAMAESHRLEAIWQSMSELLDCVETQIFWILHFAEENNVPVERLESLNHLVKRTRVIFQDLQEVHKGILKDKDDVKVEHLPESEEERRFDDKFIVTVKEKGPDIRGLFTRKRKDMRPLFDPKDFPSLIQIEPTKKKGH